MNLFGRNAMQLKRGFTNTDNYVAMARTPLVYRRPVGAWSRYLLGGGDYPLQPTLKTPTGDISPTLFSRQDTLTVNEIFCRRDYGPGGQRVIVDLGANIGLASLYFLTRRPDAVVYAAEPVPRNVERFKGNLAAFTDRCHLEERAVSPDDTEFAEFVSESSGRLGGLAEFSKRTGTMITVPCVSIASYLGGVLEKESRINLLKVDTEGSEKALIAAIPADIRSRIDAIVSEGPGVINWA